MGKSGAARRQAQNAQAAVFTTNSAPLSGAAQTQQTAAPQHKQQQASPSQPSQRHASAADALVKFSIDNPDTWVSFFRQSQNPYQNFHDHLIDRFLESWLRGGNVRNRKPADATFNYLSERLVDLLAAKTQAEHQLILKECKSVYNILLQADHKFLDGPSASNTSSNTKQQNPSQSRETTTQRNAAQSKTGQDCEALNNDDLYAWVSHLQQSENRAIDFYAALKVRFQVPLSHTCSAEQKGWMCNLLLGLYHDAMRLAVAETDKEKEDLASSCRFSFEFLRVVDCEFRKLYPHSPASQATAASGQSHAAQQQQRAGFSVDDASTWVAFLRCSSEPYLDFYVALKQRFAVPWTQAGTAAERASLHRSLLSLSVLVLGLVAAKSDAELESALTGCRAAYEVLAETDRAAQRRAAQNTAAPTATAAAPAPPQQQQQQQHQQKIGQQTSSSPVTQSSQPSTQPKSAFFSVDDLSTWAAFLRSKEDAQREFHDALKERFLILRTKTPSAQWRGWHENGIFGFCTAALRLSITTSREESQRILKRCQKNFDSMKEMDDKLRKELGISASKTTSSNQSSNRSGASNDLLRLPNIEFVFPWPQEQLREDLKLANKLIRVFKQKKLFESRP